MKKNEFTMKGSQPITNFFHRSPRVEKEVAVVLEDIAKNDSFKKTFESDCEELPETGLLSARRSPVKSSATRYDDDDDDVDLFRKYRISLDSILRQREEKARTDAKLEKLEDELKGIETGDSTVLEENALSLNKYETNHAIEITHPALEIFDQIRLYQLYLNANIEIPTNEKSDLVKLMRGCTQLEQSFFVTSGIFNHSPRLVVATPWLLKWLFHLMAISSNPYVSNSCFHTLQSVILYANTDKSCIFSWYPSILDVVAVLYNYGADLNKLLQSDSTLGNVEEKLNNMNIGNKLTPSEVAVINDEIFEGLLNHNLVLVIKTLYLFLDCSSSRYSDEDLVCFLKILFITSLDRNFIHSLLQTEMESTVAKLLSKITDTHWDKEAIPLAELLIERANHHHNLVYLAKLMPAATPRGLEFQKLLCIVAIMKLTNTEIPIDIHNMKPAIILDLLKQKSLYKIADLYLLNSVTYLLDTFVGNEPTISSRKTIQELAIILKQAAGKIKENFNCIDTTKVKDLMIRVASKFTIQAQSMPASNKTLFDYIQVQNIEPVSNSAESKEEESFKEEKEIPADQENAAGS